MRRPAAVSGVTFTLDSFLFQRRGFLSKRSGFAWNWHLFSNQEVLSGLDFRLQKEPVGSPELWLRYTATGDDGDAAPVEYSVELDYTTCSQGGRWWFRCPHLGDDEKPCGKRCRLLYLRRGQGRFGCRRCSALAYDSSNRNHDPVYVGFLKPVEALRRATIGLLRCRSEKKRLYLLEKAEAARKKIAEFSAGRWRRIASRMMKGKARTRDQRHFSELVDVLLGQEIRDLVKAAFEEPGRKDYPSVDVEELSYKLIKGFREMNEWKEAEKMFQAARRARRKTHFVLAALVTHEIRHLLRPDEHCALEFWGRREYAADLAQDPEALLRHIRFVDRKSREHVERMLAADS
ncbi:MAG: hypothetical protein V3R16_10640 [Nitrospirales bacterium]